MCLAVLTKEQIAEKAYRFIQSSATRSRRQLRLRGFICKVTVTSDELMEMLIANEFCVYCETPFAELRNPQTDITFDHITPISQGGHTSVENLAVCCTRCNAARDRGKLEKRVAGIKQQRQTAADKAAEAKTMELIELELVEQE